MKKFCQTSKCNLNRSLLTLSLLFFVQFSFSQSEFSKLLDKANEIYSSHPDSSLFYCKKAEKISKKEDLGEVCLCKIRPYLLFTDYENAEIEIQKAYDFYIKRKDNEKIGKIYRLKSNLAGRIGERENEKKYILDSYNYLKKTDNYTLIFSILCDISLFYNSEKNFDNAIIYLKKANELINKIKEDRKYFYYQNLGSFYRGKNNFQKSYLHLKKAEQIAEKFNLLDSKATIYVLLAELLKDFNIIEDANTYATKSYLLSKNNKLIYEQAEALSILIAINLRKKNYQGAFKYQTELNGIEKRILNLEKLNNIKLVKNKLTLSKKEKEITQKNLELEKLKVQKIKSDANNQRLYLLILIFFFALVFIFVIYSRTKKLNSSIQLQKKLVEDKQKEILDSITYAKRIQSAILPAESFIKEHLPELFILYKPKDIVAGDFYWFEIIEDLIFIAVADCTGHGVPGAMVSVVCNNALNRSIKEFGISNPALILDKTREIIINEFEKSKEDVNDGMDISLCVINKKTKLLEWAGAHNPLWILKKNNTNSSEIIEFKADKQPIGKFIYAKNFTKHQITLDSSDEVYLFSDGFQDQFGGSTSHSGGKKFKVSQLKALLVTLGDCLMNEKHQKLEERFDSWRGELEQVDDVCIIGFRLY